MTKAIHYLSLIVLVGTIIAYLLPHIVTLQNRLFVSFAISLMATIITRLILDAQPNENE